MPRKSERERLLPYWSGNEKSGATSPAFSMFASVNLFGKSFPLDLGDIAGNLNIKDLNETEGIILRHGEPPIIKRIENENDALILENSLIKQLKPKYNILLRDDKTYPYLCVDISEDYPRILLTRKVFKSQSIHYFGPYSSGGRDLLDSLYETFPLAQKESCLKGKKACLFYQIKRCLAPCEGKISKEDYRKILEQALECIQNPKKILAILDKKMQFLIYIKLGG